MDCVWAGCLQGYGAVVVVFFPMACALWCVATFLCMRVTHFQRCRSWCSCSLLWCSLHLIYVGCMRFPPWCSSLFLLKIASRVKIPLCMQAVFIADCASPQRKHTHGENPWNPFIYRHVFVNGKWKSLLLVRWPFFLYESRGLI